MMKRSEFMQFHRDNPWVFERLVDYCKKLSKAGFDSYSMRTMISVLRFDYDLETGGDEVVIEGEKVRVKLNNNHSPYYARLLAYKYPRFEYFFKYRRVDGEEYGRPILFSDVPGERDFPLGERPAQLQLVLVTDVGKRPPPKKG